MEAAAQAQSQPSIRRSLRHSSSSNSNPEILAGSRQLSAASSPMSLNESRTKSSMMPAQDFVGFFSNLNVNLRLVASISQDMLSFYALCDRLKEDFNPSLNAQTQGHIHGQSLPSPLARMQNSHFVHQNLSRSSSSATGDLSIPPEECIKSQTFEPEITSALLVQLLSKMQTMREQDLAHPSSGYPQSVHHNVQHT